MKIAQVSPLHESVPPLLYGGTERVVFHLTEELVKFGHEVTLFASGDSKTSARLIETTPKALRLDCNPIDPLIAHLLQIHDILERIDEFDIIHFHTDNLHFPLAQCLRVPLLTTLHGRLDIPGLDSLFAKYGNVPLVSISQAQRRHAPHGHWVANVYHGIPLDLYKPNYSGKRDYLAFLGRMSPEKGPEHAIEIARRCGTKIKMAAKIGRDDEAYFKSKIEPLLSQPHVEFIGEINEEQKQEFLRNAKALLFPICWPEPFGLVMIEAMACGTPVIGFPNGSVPEIIEDNLTGFTVNDIDEAVAAVEKLDLLTPQQIRSRFEERFSSASMAQNYLKIYQRLINKNVKKTTKGRRYPDSQKELISG